MITIKEDNDLKCSKGAEDFERQKKNKAPDMRETSVRKYVNILGLWK